MESRLRHHVEKDVLEGALNIAVDKGLSQAQVYKEAAGNGMCFKGKGYTWKRNNSV